MFYCEITFKIKKLIGMDEFKDTEDEENRSWGRIKSEFNKIITFLQEKKHSYNEVLEMIVNELRDLLS